VRDVDSVHFDINVCVLFCTACRFYGCVGYSFLSLFFVISDAYVTLRCAAKLLHCAWRWTLSCFVLHPFYLDQFPQRFVPRNFCSKMSF